MKNIALIFVLICFSAKAENTNALFVTDDGFLVGQDKAGEIRLNPEKVAQAKRQTECLPANAFPEGNWGEVQSGFQLSMRFETNTFVTGQPITAILLLRNVTNTVLTYNVAYVAGHDGPIALIATDSNGLPLSTKSQEFTVVSAHERKLYPNTQHKYQNNLDARYDLRSNVVVLRYSGSLCFASETQRDKIRKSTN